MAFIFPEEIGNPYEKDVKKKNEILSKIEDVEDSETDEAFEEESEEVPEAVTLINEAAAEFLDYDLSLKPETID